ncbi:MAG: anaerobic C4-dicarboxylate transporter [Bacteroidales bacterium]|nr:anaerobic C4-dicarboxylate transporter [Bacteroidales bacterium]
MSIVVIVELIVVLLALYVGSRYGSLALGAISGIGLAILVFGFGMKPGTPPTDVIYIIIAAVTCAGMLHAAGGMDWLIQIAEKFLRSHPDRITFFAPLCTFLLTVLVGTGHVVYTLMPIICDISLKAGVRPERPCAVASIASQVGITCSPIAAAVVAFMTISNANGYNVDIPVILMVTIPSCIIGLLAASTASYRRGKDLDKDPAFLARCADPEKYDYMYGSSATTLDKKISRKSKLSVGFLLMAIASIVVFAVVRSFMDPKASAALPKMNIVIQIVLLTAAACIIIFCKAEPKKAVGGTVSQSGMVAVVSIYGIAWLADTYFANYMPQMQSMLSGIVTKYPWSIALVFFSVSVLTNSQGAVVVSMLPLAYSLGIPGPILLGALPSVYGYFFIPNYPSDIATVNFDRSGTTVIGKYLLNHSFMMPGLISVFVSTCVAYLITTVLFPGYFASFII